MTTVPGEAPGDGTGEQLLNRGWIWSSLGALEREFGRECDIVTERETGPDREPGRE